MEKNVKKIDGGTPGEYILAPGEERIIENCYNGGMRCMVSIRDENHWGFASIFSHKIYIGGQWQSPLDKGESTYILQKKEGEGEGEYTRTSEKREDSPIRKFLNSPTTNNNSYHLKIEPDVGKDGIEKVKLSNLGKTPLEFEVFSLEIENRQTPTPTM